MAVHQMDILTSKIEDSPEGEVNIRGRKLTFRKMSRAIQETATAPNKMP
jgi:hypothetical protein